MIGCWRNIQLCKANNLIFSELILCTAHSMADSPNCPYSLAMPTFTSGKEQARWSAKLSSSRQDKVSSGIKGPVVL